MNRPWIQQSKGSYLRTSALLLILTLISIPSVANISFFFDLAGAEVDISLYQLIILLLFLLVILVKRKLHLTLSTRVLFTIVWLIVTFNTISALAINSELLTPLMRGIFNFSINVMVALIVSQFLSRRVNAKSLALAMVLFGVIVALSALGEFVLLKTSEFMLEKWRTLVWGRSVDPDSLFHVGGVRLNPMGPSRVGGLIGAPENLGYVLALTLPFVLFLGFSLVANVGILSLYTLASFTSGSRTLGIALIVYGIFLVTRRFHFNVKHKIAIIISLAVSATLVFWVSMRSDMFIRYRQEAFLYEMDWRGERLSDLVSTVGEKGVNWITGLGLGWGVDQHFGLPSVTSGVLGGDLTVAYCLGGIVGVSILIALWTVILRVRAKIPAVSGATRLAMNWYVMFLAAYSLLTPVLMQLVLGSGILTLLLLTFLVLAENTTSGVGQDTYGLRVRGAARESYEAHAVLSRPA